MPRMSPASPRRNILILHTGALGDFVLTWPLAMALSRLHPQSRIVYVTHPSKGALASRFVGTEWTSIDTNGWHTLFSEQPALQPPAQQSLERAQTIYSFLSTPDDRLSENLRTQAPEAQLHCLTPLPPAGFPDHVTQFYLEQLQLIPALAATYGQILKMLSQRGINAARKPGARILLHPGSGSARKCWPLSHFLELARQLFTRGSTVEFLVGETEAERLTPSQLDQMRTVAPLRQPSDYSQLAEELLQSILLVTNDNGPGHLAGILGTNVLSIFGPTNPAVWRPLGPAANVLHAPSLEQLLPQDVAAIAIQCAKPQEQPVKTPDDDV